MHHICAIAYSVFTMIINIFDMVRLSVVHYDLYDYQITTLTAVLFRSPVMFFLYANVYCLFAMAIERLAATIFYRQYEHSSKYNILRYILIGGQVTDYIKHYPVEFLAAAHRICYYRRRTRSAANVDDEIQQSACDGGE